MTKPDYDISIAFSDSFDLIRKHPRWLLIWGALVVLLPLVLGLPLFLWPLITADGILTDPEALGAALQQEALANLVTLAQYAVAVPVIGAVGRYILGKPAAKGLAGLRFSRDELWVFVSYVVISLVAFLIMLPVLFVGLIAGALTYSSSGNAVTGAMVFGMLLLACLVVMVWLGTRMSLLVPASIDLNTLAIGPAWRASRGHFWALFGTVILSGLICVGVTVLWLALLLLVALVLALMGGLTGMLSFDGAMEGGNWVPLAIVGALVMMVPTLYLTAATMVLYTAPFASAWAQLRPRPHAAGDPPLERM